MKITEEVYEKALAYARKKHEGQKRVGGEDYVTHPIAVARYVEEWGYGPKYRITALLHDVLEDTDATEVEILEIAGEEVLCAVKALTKSYPLNMDEYVSGIFENEIARVVKTADRLHNLRSAVYCTDSFKDRYIRESALWYFALSPEIERAARELAETMENPPSVLTSAAQAR